MEQEAAYLTALTTAATYTIRGDTLELRTADGALAVSYSATQPPSAEAPAPAEAGAPALEGTNWYATGVNNGKQAVVSLVLGSEITAVFGEDGSLTGNAGCNNYMTSYTVDGDQIQIEPAASTMMMCEEAVMEQEMAYLTALTTAATYTIRGDTLELRTADGALAVDYSAVSSERRDARREAPVAPPAACRCRRNCSTPPTRFPTSARSRFRMANTRMHRTR